MNDKFELNEKELEKIIGGVGMANPASGLTKEEAKEIAKQLGDGKDMGSWTTMSGAQFLEWWENSQNGTIKSASGSLVGGVCGYNSDDTIENCHHSGDVTG